ncbi:MAG: hypothetical protein ACRCT8_01290 [Lacipirellulaceae bacterium]
MSDPPSSRRPGRGREFLAKLGLSLPVTEADVKQAYFARARETHPDHGGSAAAFVEVQAAYQEALEYAKKRGKRMPWLGSQMAPYLATREAVELVERCGGRATVEQLDWLNDTVGEDFAHLADRLVAIDITNATFGDAELRALLEQSEGLQFLESLSLAGTRVTDDGAMRLAQLTSLKRIDLRDTQISAAMRRRLARQPGVERVEGARGFWGLRWGG